MNHDAAKTDSQIVFRTPQLADAKKLVRLVHESRVLDVNSDYAYLLMCLHFPDTCLIAEMGGEAVGFVTAYQPPQQSDSLFVWQVAVDAAARGQGLASRMLDELVRRGQSRGVRFLEATITPSNTASRALLQSLARRHATQCEIRPVFSESMFSGRGAHEPEDLFRVGPLPGPSEEP